MAFSVDQASLGTVQAAGTVSSFTLTTTHAVASGGLIVVGAGWFTASSGLTVTCSGGSLTWTTAGSVGTGASSDGAALMWALAPSGLASSTVLTIDSGVGSGFASPIAAAMSFLGSATSSPQDGTSTKSATAGNPWSGNPITTSGSSDLVIGVGWGDGNTATVTDTPTSPWTAGPLLSDSGANGGVTALVYQMNVAAAGYSPGGTWGGTSVPTTTATIGAGFLAAAGGAASTVGYGVRARPRPRGPLFKGPFQMAAQQPIGTLAPSVQNFQQSLTAGLSFAGNLQKATSRILSGGLSFTGAIITGIAIILTAGLSFAGAIQKAVVRTLSAGLSFTGAIQKATARVLSAGLSFAGAIQKATSRILSAGLSFAGAISEQVGFGLTFLAGLSFNGAFQKATVAPLTADLSFAGAVSKATSRLLTASVSFAGGILKATSRIFSAGLSFAGAINSQVGFGLLFTAALSFTGAVNKATSVNFPAGLSFSGAQQKALTRGLVVAGLGFAGGLTSAVSGGSSYPLFTTMWFAISGWLDG